VRVAHDITAGAAMELWAQQNVVDHLVEDTTVRLRNTLTKQDYDAGAATIAAQLTRDSAIT